jgi:hypothetical protein
MIGGLLSAVMLATLSSWMNSCWMRLGWTAGRFRSPRLRRRNGRIGNTGVREPPMNDWPPWNSAVKLPMATIRLPVDFRDFLKLLNSHRVEYLLIGGYAVCFHGYFRNTSDIDIWIAVNPENSCKMEALIREFGFDVPELSKDIFLQEGRLIRMGVEPTRIEILTGISACKFEDCYSRRVKGMLDGIPADIIAREDLIRNKLKSGRLKDLDDAQRLS